MSQTVSTPPAPRFENPNPFPFTREQYYRMGELGFFDGKRVELIFGEVIEQYPDDPGDPSPRPFRFTPAQYYQLGDLGFFDGKRVEFVRGEIVEMSPINWPHALGVGLVTDAMMAAFANGFWVSTQQPFAIAGWSPGSLPQPDVAVIPGSRRTATGHPTRAVLIVEVSDATFFHDITTKAEDYANADVPEYWVLDLNSRQLLVLRDPVALPAGLGTNAYRTQLTLSPTDRVFPLAVPTASIAVADLLP